MPHSRGKDSFTRPDKLPQRLTREEAAGLIAQPSKRYPTGVRNRALLRLMYRTGLRCEEALSLRPRDITFARSELRVNEGKGAKDRILYFDQVTSEFLDRWWVTRPRSEWFFCTLHGGQLDAGYVRRMVARYGMKAGITIRCHPHLLRHTFASEFLEDGGTQPELQRAMGHARAATTAIYSHVADEHLRRFMMQRPG